MHELFPQPGVYRPTSFGRQGARTRRPLVLGLLFLCTFIAGFALLGILRRAHVQAPFVLVELKALDESGHPVAAAKVSINDEALGVTDSFGEWRRYLKVAAGEKLEVELLKQGQPSLKGSRTLRVPQKKRGQQGLDIQANIALQTFALGPKLSQNKKAKKMPEKL